MPPNDRKTSYRAGIPRLQTPKTAADTTPSLADVLRRLSEIATDMGWEVRRGMQLVDGAGLARRHHPDIDPARPALVLLDGADLSQIGTVLGNQYPLDHPLSLLDHAGRALDDPKNIDGLRGSRTAEMGGPKPAYLALPMLDYPGSMLDLAEVIAHLRAPEGCPWDREQTHRSLRPYLLEEAYEAVEALDSGDLDQLADELGDVLLQVVLHAQIAVEEGSFSLPRVIQAIIEKLVRRHPHVFGEVEAETSDAVIQNWEALKREEREKKGESTSPFSGIPKAMPALARAQTVQRKAKRLTRPSDAESREESASTLPPITTESLGRALFELVAQAEASDLDAEAALREVVTRFVQETEAETQTQTQA